MLNKKEFPVKKRVFQIIREELKLTRKEMAEVLGCTTNNIFSYESTNSNNITIPPLSCFVFLLIKYPLSVHLEFKKEFKLTFTSVSMENILKEIQLIKKIKQNNKKEKITIC